MRLSTTRTAEESPMPEQFSLEEFYDAYPRVEGDFQDALDVSLAPRGPELLTTWWKISACRPEPVSWMWAAAKGSKR